MWARLQGVGISVRADTATPPPLPHKTSQPALSPGLESVSDTTCQIETKKTEKFFFLHIFIRRRAKIKEGGASVPPVFLFVSPTIFSFSGSRLLLPARHILCSLHFRQALSSISVFLPSWAPAVLAIHLIWVFYSGMVAQPSFSFSLSFLLSLSLPLCANFFSTLNFLRSGGRQIRFA